MSQPHIDSIGSEDPAAWRDALDGLTDAHAFYDPDLLAFLSGPQGGRAELVVFRDGDERVVMPWFLRHLPASVREAAAGAFTLDAVGPDYGGPIGTASLTSLERFYSTLSAWASDRGILTAFLRLNPFASDQQALDARHGVSGNRPVVWVDLANEFDVIWREFEHAARKNYNRAIAAGLQIVASDAEEHVDALAEVYAATMDRRSADSRYRFGTEYFRGLVRAASGRVLTMTAFSEGRTAASQIYLLGNGYAFSYLGGAMPEFNQERPTNGVVTEAIRALQQRHCARFILGGGYQPGDGIERFKRTFSPRTAIFRTQRIVFDPRVYRAACLSLGRSTEESDYFPAYRDPQ